MTTQDGTVLIDTAEASYDYVLSPDGQTVYFVTYSGTGAASPPNGVVAVDADTGEERWRLGQGGFVWPLANQLAVHLV